MSVPSIDSGSDMLLVCCLPVINRPLPIAVAWARAADIDR